MGNRISVTVEIPFLQDEKVDVYIVALRPNGTIVSEKMTKNGTTYKGLIKLEPGIWSLSVDFEYEGVIIASSILADEVKIDKGIKTLNFGFREELTEDIGLIGGISVPDLVMRGETVTLRAEGSTQSVNWELVYQPEESTAKLTSTGNKETSLECDKDGIYIIEAYAETESTYAVEYVYVNCVTNAIWIEEEIVDADYHEGEYFVLTKDKSFYKISESGKTELASGLKIDSFVLQDDGSKAALLSENVLYIWDIESDSQSLEVSPGQPIKNVWLITDKFVFLTITISSNYDSLAYFSLDEKTIKTTFDKIKSTAVLPETNVLAALTETGYCKLFYWNSNSKTLSEKNSIYSNVSRTIWGLKNGSFIDNHGNLFWVNSASRKLKFERKLLFGGAEITHLEHDGSETIWAVKDESFSYLVITDAITLDEKLTIELPVLKQKDGSAVNYKPLACGVFDGKASCLIPFDTAKTLITYHSL